MYKVVKRGKISEEVTQKLIAGSFPNGYKLDLTAFDQASTAAL